MHPNVLDVIGNTPLISLKRASEETGCTILGKAEFLNPGQSVKDRAALAIVKDAEAQRRAASRRRHRRRHRGQHRHWPCAHRRGERLSRHRGDAAHAKPREEGRGHRAGRRIGGSGRRARLERQPLSESRAPHRRREKQDRTRTARSGPTSSTTSPTAKATSTPPRRKSGATPTAKSMASSARLAPAARSAACRMAPQEPQQERRHRHRRSGRRGALQLVQKRRTESRRHIDHRRHRPRPRHGEPRRRRRR